MVCNHNNNNTLWLVPTKGLVLATTLMVSKTPAHSSWPVPFLGMLLFLLIHASSLWSRKVHKNSSLALLEAAVYYATLQALVLVLMDHLPILLLVDHHHSWILAQFFALHFSFRVIQSSSDNATTLSPFCLAAALFLFCLFCPLYTLVFHHHRPPLALLQAAMAGWILSEACDYCFWGLMLSGLRDSI